MPTGTRYLNLGYRLPVVGGSDKMTAASQLGGVRTYTQLGLREFTYDNWMAALRAGNTFVTVAPLAEMTIEGKAPGDVVELPPCGGTVTVEWRVESVGVPITAVEVIHGGVVTEERAPGTASTRPCTAAACSTSTPPARPRHPPRTLIPIVDNKPPVKSILSPEAQ